MDSDEISLYDALTALEHCKESLDLANEEILRLKLELKNEKQLKEEFEKDRDDLAELVVQLEDNIVQMDYDYNCLLSSKSKLISVENSDCNKISSKEVSKSQVFEENEYENVLKEEIKSLKFDKCKLFNENKICKERIEELDELVNSQQSEILELGRRLADLESPLIDDKKEWKIAKEKLGSSSPIASWRRADSDSKNKTLNSAIDTDPNPLHQFDAATTISLTSDADFFGSETKSLFSADSEGSGSETTSIFVNRKIDSKHNRKKDIYSSNFKHKTSISSNIMSKLKARSAIWGITSVTPPIHPLAQPESVLLSGLDD
jgi:hypothetical protein